MHDRLKFVVFDCDGTLVDSQHMIWLAASRAFEANKLHIPTVEEVRRVVGLSLFYAIEQLLPGHPDDFIEQIVADYRQEFMALRQDNHEEPLFPGARDLLMSLQADGYLLGMATGKAMRGVQHTLAQNDLSDFFITLQTADNNPSKPSPVMLQNAIMEAGVEPEDTVLIGDTSYDMGMARAANVHAIGVTWGYHEVDDLLDAGANEIVDDMAELGPIIDQFFEDA